MFCPECGKPVKDGARFCNHCGAKMDTFEELGGDYRSDGGHDADDRRGGGRKRKKMWLLPLLVALIVLVGLGTAFAAYQFLPALAGMLPWAQEEKTRDADAEDDLERELEDAVEADEENQKTAVRRNFGQEQEESETAVKISRETVPGKAADALEEMEEMPEDEDIEESQISGASTYGAASGGVSESSAQMSQTPVSSVGSVDSSAGARPAPAGSVGSDTAAVGSNAGTGAASVGGTAANADTADYVLPDSSSRLLTKADLAGLSKDELRLARNEIYARHGRIFTSEDLEAYFASKSWYRGTVSAESFSDSLLSQVEKDNIKLIKQMEEKLK